jgi:tryptophanyl-tRNA synthetase
VRIDPWGSSQYQDYARLRDEFGIAPFGPDDWGAFARPHRLFKRSVVFGHRDFERIAEAVKGHEPWSTMTGFMPSGDLHMGHKMVLEQVVAHQQHGADVHLAIADFEAMAARGFTLEKAKRVAMDQYVHNALALGLDPASAEYGFGGETSIAHVLAPLVQAADILHVQQDERGPRPVLVPVGVDQDPHIRLTRDIAQDWRLFSVQSTKEGDLGVFVKVDSDVKELLDAAERTIREQGYGEIRRNDAYKALYVRRSTAGDQRRIDLALARLEARRGEPGLLRPSATFHRFMTGLQGGKMSSSKPETSIYLTENPKAAEKKLMASVTGGRATAEEQRRIGAEPDKCPVYELYLYHLAKDDAHLQVVFDECRTGARLCGGCKKEAAGLMLDFLKQHKEKRDEVAHRLDEVVAKD